MKNKMLVLLVISLILVTFTSISASERYKYLDNCNVNSITLENGQATVGYNCGTVSKVIEKVTVSLYTETDRLIIYQPFLYKLLEEDLQTRTQWLDPSQDGWNGNESEYQGGTKA
jgi:hypothetical protein